MIAPHTLVTFAALALVIIVIPGPSVLFVIGRALHLGRGPALISVVGNAMGPVVHSALVALGVGALVATSAAAFTVLKIAGGLYLIWLGVQAIRHRGEGLAIEDDEPAAPSVRRLLTESFTVGVTNPKTLVFIAAVLPQFADPSRGSVAAQIMVLGLTFAALGILSDGLYVVVAAGARSWFVRSPRRLAGVRATGGGMIAVLGAVVLATPRAA